VALWVALPSSPGNLSLWPTYNSALVMARSNVRAVFVGMNKPFWAPRIWVRPFL
jgi:hypothetical protein